MAAMVTRLGWWGLAAVFMAPWMTARPALAQSKGAVPARNPAARTEHTPPRRPQQMRGVPQGEASAGLARQRTPEDVLAELVKSAGVIFAGQVYAIRMPVGESNPGTKGGLHSSRPHVVEVEFRVDQGVRGPSVGDPFVLRESEDQWRQDAPLLAVHQRAIVFLYPPDKSGLSSPVGGRSRGHAQRGRRSGRSVAPARAGRERPGERKYNKSAFKSGSDDREYPECGGRRTSAIRSADACSTGSRCFNRHWRADADVGNLAGAHARAGRYTGAVPGCPAGYLRAGGGGAAGRRFEGGTLRSGAGEGRSQSAMRRAGTADGNKDTPMACRAASLELKAWTRRQNVRVA